MKLEEAIKTTRFDSDAHKAALNVLFSAWWLKTALSKALKDNGLTHEQYNVLRILKGKNPEQMCVRDIASRMIEKSSNVPRILDRLLAKKLVKRRTSQVDRRETEISLTTAGLKLLEKSGTQINAIMDHEIRLNAQEARQLNLLLEKMRFKD